MNIFLNIKRRVYNITNERKERINNTQTLGFALLKRHVDSRVNRPETTST